jgi:hypothetical protein
MAMNFADSLFATGRSKDSLYEPVLADSEREAVAELLGSYRLPRYYWNGS